MKQSRQQPPANQLLAALSTSDLAALKPYLKVVDLPQGVVLFEVGQPIDRVYFPHSGVVSLVVPLESGETIELAMVGRESLVGGAAGLRWPRVAEQGDRTDRGRRLGGGFGRLRRLAESSTGFRATLMRHEQLVLVQAQQSAACNATHSVEARLSRWLLRCRDLQGGDDLELTQEFLSQMLGVRRTSVSVVANTLQAAGLIRYRRGHIRVINLEELQDTACECYETVRAHAKRLLADQ